MRRLGKNRPKLTAATRKRLAKETAKIAAHADAKDEASRRYTNARGCKWFGEVIKTLASLSGVGQRCMLCSGSEASDLEHFYPKAVFPLQAMEWTNYLWACAICNRHKRNRFPPDTEPGGRLINPVDEDVWEFFFIDEFGFLTPVFDVVANSPNLRAVSTRDILSLNRDALQESRFMRLKDLRSRVTDSLKLYAKGEVDIDDLRKSIADWREDPFQSDVPDYFLGGPGKMEVPFRDLFAVVEAV